MGPFKGKPMDKQVEEQRNKLQMKALKLKDRQLDLELIQANREKNMAVRRLTA